MPAASETFPLRVGAWRVADRFAACTRLMEDRPRSGRILLMLGEGPVFVEQPD